MSVHALGESIFESGWTFKGQRSSYEITLRRGFRCRKIFTSGSSHANAALMNRLFEWYIVKDTDPRNLGQPKFVLHELPARRQTCLYAALTDGVVLAHQDHKNVGQHVQMCALNIKQAMCTLPYTQGTSKAIYAICTVVKLELISSARHELT